jgi:predicted secreted protein
MQVTTAIAIYFLIWWITLFAVLPWGVTAQGPDSPPGTDPGAPMVPRLVHKLIWTTIVSTVIFAILAFLYIYRIVTLDDLGRWMGV